MCTFIKVNNLSVGDFDCCCWDAKVIRMSGEGERCRVILSWLKWSVHTTAFMEIKTIFVDDVQNWLNHSVWPKWRKCMAVFIESETKVAHHKQICRQVFWTRCLQCFRLGAIWIIIRIAFAYMVNISNEWKSNLEIWDFFPPLSSNWNVLFSFSFVLPHFTRRYHAANNYPLTRNPFA